VLSIQELTSATKFHNNCSTKFIFSSMGRDPVQGYPFRLQSPIEGNLYLPDRSYTVQRDSEALVGQESHRPQRVSRLDHFLSPFFLTEKSSGNKCFISNLQHLNIHIKLTHFKLKDWHTVIRLMFPRLQMITFDLVDAYFSVSIAEDHRKFLCFDGATHFINLSHYHSSFHKTSS